MSIIINLSIIYDEKKYQHVKYFDDFKSKALSNRYEEFKINLLENCVNEKELDFTLIISDNIRNDINKFELLNIKKVGIPIFVVTSNLSTENIVECINFTPYVAYIKGSNLKVLQKILKIVKLNKNGIN